MGLRKRTAANRLFALLFGLVTAAIAPGEDLTRLSGFWNGTISVSAGSLPVGIHVTDTQQVLAVDLEDPAQGIPRLGASLSTYSEGKLSVEFRSIEGTYSAVLSADGQALVGTWSQGGKTVPVTLKKATGPIQIDRPQDPRGSLPYKTLEVTIPTKVQGIQLAGTLDLPPGPGPFPAVVLISGSGPNDRNETILGHRPFLVLADALARRGIASLRYDKRGVGASTGQFNTAGIPDFADDAEAAFTFLSLHPDVKKSSVGLVGHSEGGLVAPMVASRNPEVAFLVLLAGPGLPGDKLLVLQERALARINGTPEVTAAQAAALNMKLYQIVKGSSGTGAGAEEEYRKAFLQGLEEINGLTPGEVEQAKNGVDRQIKASFSPWMKSFLSLDPEQNLVKVKVPVLALNGDKDLQVPATENLSAVKKALSGGSAKNQILGLPGLNHLFQHAGTGSPEEYGIITETMAPEVLTRISDWILELGPAKPTPTP